MEEKDFFDLVKDSLYFRVKASIKQGEKDDVLKVKTKEDRYFLTAYIEKESLTEKSINVKKLSFDEYTDIVLESVDVDGVAIKVEEEYTFIHHLYLRQLRMNQDWERFLHELEEEECAVEEKREERIEEYHQRKYIDCLSDVKKMWDMKAYRKTYEVLLFLVNAYPQNTGELLYYCGMVLEKVGNINDAERLYRNAIKEENNYWLYYRLAQFYRRIGRSDEEKRVYENAYTHHRFYRFTKEPENDGVQYVLKALIQHESMKKKRLQRFVYMRYAREVNKRYKSLPELKVYDYLGDSYNGLN